MKILYKIPIFICLSLVVSCVPDKGDTNFLNDRANSIFFSTDKATMFVKEGEANTIDITIGASAVVDNTESYTITVDPTSTAVEGVDFTILSSETSFKSGDLISKVTIKADFDNAITDGKKAIFKLVSTSENLEVASKDTFTLNLFKLCEFTGLNTANYTASVYAFGEEAPSYDLVLNPVAGTNNQWTIDSAWGPEFVAWATGNSGYSGLYVYSATIILNEDFSIDVIGGSSWATGGTGLFSPCTQEFSFTLGQALFTSSFTVDVVLSPN